ncbi:hypothetical protein MBOE_04130 [Mycolicibacterium boenickei]|uniref:Uncharacterized protein n=1 Tax=Mycolicibacterium boenickei TaxID=146017 RepID=A0ABM7IPP4_9MYCO|nr:hypothetical protein MBOE_04130 [Mycolicibacterium boenickei]
MVQDDPEDELFGAHGIDLGPDRDLTGQVERVARQGSQFGGQLVFYHLHHRRTAASPQPRLRGQHLL